MTRRRRRDSARRVDVPVSSSSSSLRNARSIATGRTGTTRDGGGRTEKDADRCRSTTSLTEHPRSRSSFDDDDSRYRYHRLDHDDRAALLPRERRRRSVAPAIVERRYDSSASSRSISSSAPSRPISSSRGDVLARLATAEHERLPPQLVAVQQVDPDPSSRHLAVPLPAKPRSSPCVAPPRSPSPAHSPLPPLR